MSDETIEGTQAEWDIRVSVFDAVRKLAPDLPRTVATGIAEMADANLRRRAQALTADEVRQVVADVVDEALSEAGPQRNDLIIKFIADGVASQLAGRAVTLSAEERIALEFLRNDAKWHGRDRVVAVLDRLLAQPEIKP